jgi:DNA-binding CsgD family transcriptional regulator
MDSLVLDWLTQRQLECLRLAARPMTSKEIGRELNISPRTVEGHLDKAVQILGANSRIEAVRLLGALEGAAYNLRTYSPALADPTENRTIASPDQSGHGKEEMQLQSSGWGEQVPLRGFFDPANHRLPLPFPSGRRRRNDLTIWQRVGWTFAIIIALALATGFLLSSLSSISAVARALSH